MFAIFPNLSTGAVSTQVGKMMGECQTTVIRIAGGLVEGANFQVLAAGSKGDRSTLALAEFFSRSVKNGLGNLPAKFFQQFFNLELMTCFNC